MEDRLPLESTIVRDILHVFRGMGICCWKIHGSGYQTKGLPDLIGIARNGRLVGLEVKRPKPSGYGATALQVKTLREINHAGGYGCIVRSQEEALAAIHLASIGHRIHPLDDLEVSAYV